MNFDVVIVGSGLAGLSVALRLPKTYKIALICKRTLWESASNFAQGGIAAVLDPVLDSIEEHVADTMTAGAGLCDEEATRFIVEHGGEAVDWLIDQGVPFSKDTSTQTGYHLTREGGHSQRRIIHAADATGHVVQQTLEKIIRSRPNIHLFENHFAVDLITSDKLYEDKQPLECYGLYVLNEEEGLVHTFAARHTVLATGGAGKVYLYTTNPDTSTGDGVAMAWRAGARVSNMEFVQFHPTCLYHPYAKSFLISESVRGEGGLLKLPPDAGSEGGMRFMPEHDPRAELAPRDIVARSIDFEMKKRGLDYVHLDISHQDPQFLKEHFPTIYARCLELGIEHHKGTDSRRPGNPLYLWRRRDGTKGRTVSRTCMRSAKRLVPACMARTVLPAIRCWNVWSSGRQRLNTSPVFRKNLSISCLNGMKAAYRTPMKKSSFRITGMNSGASCGITSVSSGRRNVWNEPSAGFSC